MKKFRTVVSGIVMAAAGIAGFFLGALWGGCNRRSDLVLHDRRNCLHRLCNRQSGFIRCVIAGNNDKRYHIRGETPIPVFMYDI